MFTEDKVVIFPPEFDPELKRFNEEMAREIEAEGGKVLHVKVKVTTQVHGSGVHGKRGRGSPFNVHG